jgi:putative salt-induced outer membrane protein YdiY
MHNVKVSLCLLVLCAAWAPVVTAQQTDPVPQGLSGSASFGLSLTQGNTDTLTINAADDSIYDPKTRNLMKWNALYLRGKQNDVLSVNRVAGSFRDEYTVSKHFFMFAQFDALHDTFKGVDYLYAPTGGVGYKAVDTKRTTLDFNAGVGAVLEKDTGLDPNGSGAGTFGQKFVYQVTEAMTLKQSMNTLFKENDLGDWLYAFDVGVSAKINSRLSLSVDLLDTFKNRPVDGLTHKHDLALVTSIVTKY